MKEQIKIFSHTINFSGLVIEESNIKVETYIDQDIYYGNSSKFYTPKKSYNPRFRSNKNDRPLNGKHFTKKTNPSDKNGEISKCNVRGSIYHWTKQHPDFYENIMRSKDESKMTLVGENVDTLIEKTLNMAVIDSKCTKTVYGDI